jgi:hypothetical protein
MERISTALFPLPFVLSIAVAALGLSAGSAKAQDAAAVVDAPTPQTSLVIRPQSAGVTGPDALATSQIAPTAVGTSDPAQVASPGGLHHGSQFQGTRPAVQQGSGLHFSLWERTPLDVFEPASTVRSDQSSSALRGPDAEFQGSPFVGANRTCANCGLSAVGVDSVPITGRSGLPGVAGQMNLEQFMRAGGGMNLSSSFGTFRMSYSDPLSGNAAGAGGIGRGTAQARFSSSTTGNMFNFSAATTLGEGPSHGGLGGAANSNAFGNADWFGSTSGAADAGKRSTTSVTMRLSF